MQSLLCDRQYLGAEDAGVSKTDQVRALCSLSAIGTVGRECRGGIYGMSDGANYYIEKQKPGRGLPL